MELSDAKIWISKNVPLCRAVCWVFANRMRKGAFCISLNRDIQKAKPIRVYPTIYLVYPR